MNSDMSPKLAIISTIPLSPIIAIVIAFMAGVLTSHYLAPANTAVLIALGLSLAGIAASLGRRWRFVPVVLILTLWSTLGILSYHIRYQRCAENDIVRYSCEKPVLVRLRAEVLDDSQWLASASPWPADPTLYFPVRVGQIHTRQGWTSASGLLKVGVKRPFRSIVLGERLEFLGMFSRYQSPQNPGEFDWRQYKRFEGQLCRLTVDNGAALRRLEPTAAQSSPGLLVRFRRHFSNVLSDECFPAESNSLLKAMVLGERDITFRRLNEAFQKTGLFHFLCVSGQNLSLLAGFIWFVGLIVGIPRRAGALLVMAVVVLYSLLVPAQSPIIRASIMVCVLCLAEISGRRGQLLHALALAALLVLLWRPAEIFNIGFQLSFMIVASLIVLCPRLTRLLIGGRMADWAADPGTHPRPRVEQIGQWFYLWFIRLFSTCLIAWFVSMPLLVYSLGWFNPWASIYSVLAAPLVVAITISGYVTTILGSVFPVLADGLRTVSLSLADLFYRTAMVLSKIPGIIPHLPAPPLMLLVGFYGWLILVATRPKLRWGYNLATLKRAWLIPPFLALLAIYLWWSGPIRPANTLAFHLLAVGNGQACILELPNGTSLAYDMGNMTGDDLTSRTVIPFLRSKHLRGLDALVISHPNWDHYSAAPELIKEACIPTLIVSPYFQDDPERKRLSALLRTNAATKVVCRPTSLTGTGDTQIEILWPPRQTIALLNLTTNESSLVTRITYAGQRILLTGDISPKVQRLLLAQGTDLRADVLIWPHHGAIVETTESFFKAVNPRIVLVSCDARRAERIQQQNSSPLLSGRKYYTTSESGSLTVLLSTKDVEAIPFSRLGSH